MNVALMDVTVTVEAPVPISVAQIADTLCSALEGGSTYWCEGFSVQTYVDGAEWGHEQVALGGCWKIKLFEEDEWQTMIGSQLRLTNALKKFATDYPRHFGDMRGDTGDAETGDILFQLLCFGEVVYG